MPLWSKSILQVAANNTRDPVWWSRPILGNDLHDLSPNVFLNKDEFTLHFFEKYLQRKNFKDRVFIKNQGKKRIRISMCSIICLMFKPWNSFIYYIIKFSHPLRPDTTILLMPCVFLEVTAAMKENLSQMIPNSVFHCLKWFLSYPELRALKLRFCVGHTQFLNLF